MKTRVSELDVPEKERVSEAAVGYMTTFIASYQPAFEGRYVDNETHVGWPMGWRTLVDHNLKRGVVTTFEHRQRLLILATQKVLDSVEVATGEAVTTLQRPPEFDEVAPEVLAPVNDFYQIPTA